MKTTAHEVCEQESGVYLYPDEVQFDYSWAIYLWPDGSADIYKSRNPKTGALLGKPIRLTAPERKSRNKEIIQGLISKRVHPECIEYVKAELEK